MIKAIIFDFDGVIVESVDIKTRSFAKLFEPEGKGVVKRIVQYHTLHTGVSRFEKFRYIYKNILNRKLLGTDFDRLCRRFSELVIDDVVSAPFVKGAKEFLDKNKGAINFYICSATPDEEIKLIVKRRGMLDYFKRIYGAPTRKTDIVKRIIGSVDLLPKEIVYVGDAFSDYKSAEANSINFIARINNNKEIFDNLGCLKINDLTELDNVLKGL